LRRGRFDREHFDVIVEFCAFHAAATHFLRFDFLAVAAFMTPLCDGLVDNDLPLLLAWYRVNRIRTRLHRHACNRRSERNVQNGRLVGAGTPQLSIRNHVATNHGAAARRRPAVTDQRTLAADCDQC
jgi:hypothetical protein